MEHSRPRPDPRKRLAQPAASRRGLDVPRLPTGGRRWASQIGRLTKYELLLLSIAWVKENGAGSHYFMAEVAAVFEALKRGRRDPGARPRSLRVPCASRAAEHLRGASGCRRATGGG